MRRLLMFACLLLVMACNTSRNAPEGYEEQKKAEEEIRASDEMKKEPRSERWKRLLNPFP